MNKMYLKCLSTLLFTLITIATFAQKTITGTVREVSGPLPGVSVSVKGTSKATQTDGNGKFSIAVNPDETLTFSAIGYARQEVIVGSQTTISITLKEDSKALNDVVVTAFGIQKQQKSLGYSTATVSAKELTEAGNTNFASALYGKASGVQVTTAPGGASSAVNVQIRGVNSLNYNAQPLYVVDGVVIRSEGQYGAAGRNNGGFFDDQRVRGNGVLDINPEDIESLSVLKGASASALYGSDAGAGVIIITTKKGAKGKGPTVDVNYFGTVEQPAFLPNYQNVYGQGYDRATNLAVGATEEGWIVDAQSPSGFRPNFRSYANFGPKMEGQQVRWWDGSIRSFSPQPDNYKDIFRNGLSSSANIALSNQTDNYSYRISYTRLDYEGIQRESGLKKNSFSLNSSLKLNKKLSVDVVANYVNTITNNRAYQTNRLAQSFDGFFGRNEDTNLIRDKFQTSEGYAWVPFNQTARNPAEAFVFNVRPNLYDYFWSTLKNTSAETENRLYSSATLNWDILTKLKFRGRVGNDYTGRNTEDKNYSQFPVAFNPPTSSTGAYTTGNGTYTTIYSDALLTYSDNISKDLSFSASAGFTSRKENYKDQSSGTQFGLVSENWFSLSNSYGILQTSASRRSLLKYGAFGILNLSYKDYLFVEGTMRQESSSSLPPLNNTYYYPSVNGSFVFTDAFKGALPEFLSYGKLRASYGVVANASLPYESNVSYGQNSLQTNNGSVPQLVLPGAYGNENLQPEKKYEQEYGLETRFLNGRFGIDLSYYTNRIKNQILRLQISPSNGSGSQIVNVGEIGSKGWELSLNAKPVVSTNFNWQTTLNFSQNKTTVYSLAPGIPELIFYNAEDNAIRITAKPGEDLGNIYVYPTKTNAAGQKIVNDDGFYVIDKSQYVKAGNVTPSITGGLSNNLNYKSFSISFLVDYRFGSDVVSTPLKYATGTGVYENTLQYRDTENGGLTYYVNSAGANVLLPNANSSSPAGHKVYHDGVILSGVKANGQPNDVILDAASYYFNSFAAGSSDALNQEGAVYKNNFIKLRELTLGYRLPNSLVKKVGMSNMKISLIGRNLLYFHRTLKNLDPETLIGDRWYSQGVDNGSLPATRSFGFSLNASF
ncbi:SusC/RagA family TonB-linked outer membrane protein [Pedobacter mendelii]|uniref:SusC/RagA family TonB-linked outer membrane protein n=1 Tax=Pedobacter mendelii TaxID=1908240 RepID=A0ABQ2BM13_9SPHI|nr:SusC/RagA family TonB-linked outer membrane protein [Pedobacter mendelii]GGI27503.1 SusC/RagA family TonB-linked outer membrane protein [Pedobacter mendelii]